MANTMKLIATTAVPSGGSSEITFTSIPGTYTDLCIKFSGRVGRAVATTPMWLRFNSDAGTNYTMKLILGNGTAVDTLTYNLGYFITGYVPGSSANSYIHTTGDIYIPSYASSNQKSMSSTIVFGTDGTSAYNGISLGTWSGTSAITSITLLEGNGNSNFSQYSTFSLYGISNS